ncbi:hypothetical protein CP532_4527 [Ophiocordyceps camponoti-leonardi (nom. inval.)]|nr:hypothetical protein CP532_4527 [Ophiocordyceps camponoti-leonardi (nom. inval.)]
MKFLAMTALAVCFSAGVLAAPSQSCSGNPARKRDLGFAGGPSKRSMTAAADANTSILESLRSFVDGGKKTKGKEEAKTSEAKKDTKGEDDKKDSKGDSSKGSDDKESTKGSSEKKDPKGAKEPNSARLVFSPEFRFAKKAKGGNDTVGKFTHAMGSSKKADFLGLKKLLQDSSGSADDKPFSGAAQFSRTTDVKGASEAQRKSDAAKKTTRNNQAASTDKSKDAEATEKNGESADTKGGEASGGNGAAADDKGTENGNEKGASSDGKQNTADMISNTGTKSK